jgi:nucleotide-binding universal stress UspA family protein
MGTTATIEPEEFRTMMKRILVPVDFSPPSLQALDYAIDLRRRLGGELVLLHAVEPVYFAATNGIYGVGYDASIVYREMEHAARQQLTRLAATVRARRIPVRIVLSVGPAPRVIADAAKKLKADLVVMSTHGRSGLSHVLLGSVAERVVRTAPCPVLTIRPRRPRAARRGPRAARSAARA